MSQVRRTDLPGQAQVPTRPATDAPLADWALWCAEVGRLSGAWKVFPCVPGEKRPLHKGWQDDAASDRKTVETVWLNDPTANIGLAIQPGFVAIDCDLYKPGAGAALDAFEAAHGELPRTFESNTPRGGIHLIFSTTKTFGNGTGSLPDFGDVRGYGGLIVGPGSIFDGKRYTVALATLPVPLPAHIEAMLCERNTRDRSKPDEPVQGVTVDDPHNVSCFTDWCAGTSRRTIATPTGWVAEPCLEGQGGNNRLTATGAMAHDYGLSPDRALEIALVHFNPRCEPPWDDNEFEKTFLSGYRSATGKLGSHAPACDHSYLFTPVLATLDGKNVNDNVSLVSPPEATSGRPKGTLTFYYLDALDSIPEPTWIIDGILPEGGYTLAYGKRSTMKSFAALDMGLSLATGAAYHGRAVKQGRIVYFAGEGFQGTNNRIKAWFKMHKQNRANYARDFVLVPFTSKWDTAAGRDLVRQHLSAIAKDGPISIVIIDTARRAMSGDENAPTSVGQFLDGVNAICREFSCGSLIVHHAGKDQGKGARGGSNFEDDADAVLRFTKGTGGMVHMKCTKQKDSESDWTMKFRAESITLGSKPDGKPITSLALVLDGESMAEDGEATPAKGDVYEIQDAMAVRILDAMEDPSADRGKLSIAVMGEMSPEMRETDPNAFNKCLRAYKMHLTRLSPKSPLWQYVHEKNAKGQALTFRNPEHKGRRASKPGQHKTLNYTLPNEEEG